jgi:hypothetical protein
MNFPQLRRSVTRIGLFVSLLLLAAVAHAQDEPSSKNKQIYEQIKAFTLNGGSVSVTGLTLARDRALMTFSGTFFFSPPVNGRVTGAVFVGNGKFIAETPPSVFEKDNLKRLLDTDVVESDFSTAVLRFSDDTFERIGKSAAGSANADPQLQKLATEHDARILKQTGANLPARLAASILNQESPGFFFATFDGGKRGRFSLILDYQSRIPVANFGINGGEKGLIFTYKSDYYDNEVWLAFYGQDDYRKGSVVYSDLYDELDVSHYDMRLDLREHKKALRLLARVTATARFPNLRAIPFRIGESLGEYEDERLNKQMRLKSVKFGQKELTFAQEDWEGGFTVFLDRDTTSGETLEFEFTLEGDFIADPDVFRYRQSVDYFVDCDCHYPRSNTTWFPRNGYLDRATFDLTFWHPKNLSIASVGDRVSEGPHPEIKDTVVTKYQMKEPIPLATFALAPFKRYSQNVRFDQGGVGEPIQVEFNSLPGSRAAIKEDFIMAEIDNSLRYFTTLFGKYPYPVLRAAFHPYGFGQGLPSLLMIPATDRASKYTYVFISHETAHQWWGDVVSWRSYRDQWLSEGFAEYSGIMYTGMRDGAGSRDELISQLRESLRLPPRSEVNFGKGRLVDVGPLILGHRLSTRKTRNAYTTLIYNKGALVLRMLHSLFLDPNTGQGDGFFDMMTDFVNRYRNKSASTDDFRMVANEHFARSPIGRMYRLNNLDWFFQEWVYGTELPSYEMQYQIQDEPDGKVLLKGTVKQENVPDKWFMILPVVFSFGGKQKATGSVHAYGPTAEFQIRLPARPTKVELDPDHWVLSAKTSTKGN